MSAPTQIPPSLEVVAHELWVANLEDEAKTLNVSDGVVWFAAGVALGIFAAWLSGSSLAQLADRFLRWMGI